MFSIVATEQEEKVRQTSFSSAITSWGTFWRFFSGRSWEAGSNRATTPAEGKTPVSEGV
jgi:hypothetical protein